MMEVLSSSAMVCRSESQRKGRTWMGHGQERHAQVVLVTKDVVREGLSQQQQCGDNLHIAPLVNV